jgi:hypothetical protein
MTSALEFDFEETSFWNYLIDGDLLHAPIDAIDDLLHTVKKIHLTVLEESHPSSMKRGWQFFVSGDTLAISNTTEEITSCLCKIQG